MRTIEEIIKEANSKGLTVSNLFQLITSDGTVSAPARPTGEWQANFHHATGWYDYGRGDSAVEALEDALARCKGAKGPENRPIPKVVKAAVESVEVDDLI
jgi:hypothetical protein